MLAILAIFAPFSSQGSSHPPGEYRTGFGEVQALGRDIYRSLAPEERALLSPQLVSLETSPLVSVHPLYVSSESRTVRGVWVSAGFIDLVNRFAHACAIDRVQRGYLRRYIQLLERSSTGIEPLPEGGNPEFWSLDVLNEQQSNFNSIVAFVLGTAISHHHLGHFDKYRSRCEATGTTPASINNLLTEKEWAASWRSGVQCALNTGCMTEGVIPFLEALDALEPRPTWRAQFLPDNARFASIKKQMTKLQRKFLRN